MGRQTAMPSPAVAAQFRPSDLPIFSHMPQAAPHYVVKLSPQPQLPFELGFLKTNSDLLIRNAHAMHADTAKQAH